MYAIRSYYVFVSFLPRIEAAVTRSEEMKIMMMPKADNLPHRPSSANRSICTASTSDPGRERTTERVNSLTNMVAMRIQPDRIPGIRRGITMRRIVAKALAPHTREDSSRWL